MSNRTEPAVTPAPRPEPRAVLVRIAIFALSFRLFSAVLAFLTNVVFPLYQPEQFATVFGPMHKFWDTFTRYDSGNFYQIARFGYTEGPMAYVPGGRSTIAYFPVYPLLMRYVGRLFGREPSDVYFGGIVVSWAAFVIAMVVLYRLARLDLPRRRAERAVLYTAVFPFAFFFGVVYTEATFLLFTVLAFYCFRTRRWMAGGVAGALAAATRVNGIMALPALTWVAWQHSGPAVRDRIRAAAGLVLVACGLGAYSLYIYRISGNPLEWAAAIQRWGYYPGGAPWMPLINLVRVLVTHPYSYLVSNRVAPYDTLNGASAILFAVAVPFVWRRLGAAYGLFMAANLWLPLSSGQFEGSGRYCAVMFPCFIWLATVRNRWAAPVVLVVSATIYTLCLALFTNIHPLF